MLETSEVSVRQACKEIQLSRSTFSYQRKVDKDIALIEQLTLLVDKHPSIGFWMCFYRLRNMGFNVYSYEPHISVNDNEFVLKDIGSLLKYKFDGIFSHNALEHFQDPVKEMKLMKSMGLKHII